jgi:pantoate--beta-alanine ligase
VAARDRWVAGERSAERLREQMRAVLETEPLANVEYVSVADGATLEELDALEGPTLLSLAVRFGTTRLIDNEPLGASPATA